MTLRYLKITVAPFAASGARIGVPAWLLWIAACGLAYARPEQREGCMTKAEIARAMHRRVDGVSMKEATELVELVFETVKEMLGRGEKVKLSGFGNFVLRDKCQREGRNPRTGESLVLTARRVLVFKESPILKRALNPREDVGADAAEE
jgi:integration host factor subunit alpha